MEEAKCLPGGNELDGVGKIQRLFGERKCYVPNLRKPIKIHYVHFYEEGRQFERREKWASCYRNQFRLAEP